MAASPERLAIRVAQVSIGVSAILAVVKIWVGLASGSVALVSDGFESGADFFTATLVLLGLWVAAKPADRDHPYGHGRFEIVVGLAIGAVLVASGTAISLRALEERNVIHRIPSSTQSGRNGGIHRALKFFLVANEVPVEPGVAEARA